MLADPDYAFMHACRPHAVQDNGARFNAYEFPAGDWCDFSCPRCVFISHPFR